MTSGMAEFSLTQNPSWAASYLGSEIESFACVKFGGAQPSRHKKLLPPIKPFFCHLKCKEMHLKEENTD